MFRFESMWLKDSRCEEVVKAAWEEGVSLQLDWVIGAWSDAECLWMLGTNLNLAMWVRPLLLYKQSWSGWNYNDQIWI